MSVDELIKLISKATGIFYPINSTLKTITDNHNKLIIMKSEYDESLKRKILDSSALNDIERALLISNITKSTIAFVNQAQILGVAIENINKEQISIENIDDDYLLYFFDQAKNISDADVQYIWGKLLAYSLDGTINRNKKIINILSLMSQGDIDSFCTICSMSYDNVSKQGGQYPFIYISEHPGYYNRHGIRRYNMAELDNLGLIEYNVNKNFVLPSEVPILRYGNNVVKLKSCNRIINGNVRLTDVGRILYRITTVDKFDDFLKYCKSIWDKHDIEYTIEEYRDKI